MNGQNEAAPQTAARVADLLRSARGGRRQVDVADAIQVTQAGYSAWERGERIPKPTYWKRIEQVLKLDPGSISRVMYGTGPGARDQIAASPHEVGTKEDHEILATIGELTEENRELVKSMLRTMLEHQRSHHG